jgi:hypothetical protein
MTGTKRFLLAAVAVSGLCGLGLNASAADHEKAGGGHAMHGVLIDNACGAKQKDEAAAAKHPLKCAMKEACAASGYQLVVGDKHYKLDDKGNEQAKAYLAKADSTHVTVEGKMDGDTMQVTSIKAADKAGGKEDGHKKDGDKKDAK